MTHHIYWKTPFEKTLDYARVKDQKLYPTPNDMPQKYRQVDDQYRELRFNLDCLENRFDIGDKKQHVSCGQQGEKAKTYTPFIDFFVKGLAFYKRQGWLNDGSFAQGKQGKGLGILDNNTKHVLQVIKGLEGIDLLKELRNIIEKSPDILWVDQRYKRKDSSRQNPKNDYKASELRNKFLELLKKLGQVK